MAGADIPLVVSLEGGRLGAGDVDLRRPLVGALVLGGHEADDVLAEAVAHVHLDLPAHLGFRRLVVRRLADLAEALDRRGRFLRAVDEDEARLGHLDGPRVGRGGVDGGGGGRADLGLHCYLVPFKGSLGGYSAINLHHIRAIVNRPVLRYNKDKAEFGFF